MAVGRFCWYDLMTTDVEAGKNFYTSVIGWGIEKWDNADFDYPMWTTARGPIGGAAALPEEAQAAGSPPHWIAYVEVADINTATTRVQELGGAVHMAATEIPDTGEFAVVADPQGAVFALYQPKGNSSEATMPEAGDFSWNELMTSNHDDALEFYSALFGWESTEVHEMAPGAEYVIYGQPGNPMPLGGMFTKTEEMQGPPAAWVYYITVDGLEDTLDKVRGNGGQVIVEPMEVPGGDRIAHCVDPQGAFFALHEVHKAADA